ncbi:hypothetical protein HDV57DRAFT_223418 [Trichoderma longibrachiatum]
MQAFYLFQDPLRALLSRFLSAFGTMPRFFSSFFLPRMWNLRFESLAIRCVLYVFCVVGASSLLLVRTCQRSCSFVTKYEKMLCFVKARDMVDGGN